MNLSVVSDFFKDISSFLGSSRALGIDIGTSSIKLVEIAKKGENFLLENYAFLESKGYLERSNEAIQTSSLLMVEKEVIKLLEILLSQITLKTKTVVVSVPAFMSFIVPIEIPLLSPKETAKVINFQARQYIPMPIDKASIDWLKVEEFENQKGQSFQRIILIAFPNDIVKKYKKIFKAVGLKLAAIEVEHFSLVRSLLSPKDPITMIVDLGAESTSVAIIEKGTLRYTGQTDHGGVTLTKSVARSLEISSLRAEELKRRRGILEIEGGEYELSTLILPFLDVIIQEVMRIQAVYEKNYQKKVEQLILVGGGANLLGIDKYFSRQIGLSVFQPRLFSRIKYPNEIEPIIKALNHDLALASGLALKRFL